MQTETLAGATWRVSRIPDEPLRASLEPWADILSVNYFTLLGQLPQTCTTFCELHSPKSSNLYARFKIYFQNLLKPFICRQSGFCFSNQTLSDTYIYNKNNPSDPHVLLRGMENGATTVGNNLAVPQKAKQRTAM